MPGAPTETVNVSGEAPVVNTVSDVLGGTFTNELINELPLQGRDFQNLLDLQPGIQRVPGGGFQHTTSNGNRREDMNYIVDLKNVITDTHFAARDRMGRSLVFMARILQDGKAREIRDIAVDERTSVLLDPDGQAVVVGAGHAYFMESRQAPEVCKAATPLTFRRIAVRSLAAGQRLDVTRWRSNDGISYTLSVEAGVIKSSLPGGSIYAKAVD